MRLCHGHDESLTIPGADKSEEEQRLVDNQLSNLVNVPSFLVTCESIFKNLELTVKKVVYVHNATTSLHFSNGY